MNGTRKCVPSPTDFGNTPRKRSNITALLPPSTARRWSKRGRRGQAGFARRDVAGDASRGSRSNRRVGLGTVPDEAAESPSPRRRDYGVHASRGWGGRARTVVHGRAERGTREAEAHGRAGKVGQRIRRRLRSRHRADLARDRVRRKSTIAVTNTSRVSRDAGGDFRRVDFAFGRLRLDTLMNSTSSHGFYL